MLPRTSHIVPVEENAEEIGLCNRDDMEGDCAQGSVEQDSLQSLAVLSAESVVSSFASDASSTLTEQMEFETGTDFGSLALSPSVVKECPTPQTRVDSVLRSCQEVLEASRVRHDVLGEFPEERSLESPVAAVILEKTCLQDETPTDRMVCSVLTFFSEKENPRSPQAGDLEAFQSITRAPMKPARMSVLNQTVKSSSVRRRLNFDGL